MAVRNKSSIFILPMITGIPYKYFKEFINCYIGCNYEDGDGKRIYIAFRSTDLAKDKYESGDEMILNKERISILKSNDCFVRDECIGDYELFIYEPDDKFKDDFDRFLNGRYSEFSDTYKRLLKSLYPTIEKLKAIISPTDKDRNKLAKELMCDKKMFPNSEIYSIPEHDEESFSLAHFLEIEL